MSSDQLPKPIKSVGIGTYQNAGNAPEQLAAFIKDVKNTENISLSVSEECDAAGSFRIHYGEALPIAAPSDGTPPNINRLAFNAVNPLAITGATIGHLIFRRPGHSVEGFVKDVQLENCLISKLEIELPHPSLHLRLKNCWIGNLSLVSSAINDLTIVSGGICKITSTAPDQENPFTGSVRFDGDIFWPTTPESAGPYSGPQGYRDFRAHLEKLENIPAANQMRALVLRAERHDDSGLTRNLNWVYDKFCEYGLKPGLPLKWIACTYFALVLVAWIGGGADPGLAEKLYFGVHENLLDEGWRGGLWRAAHLPLQSLLNPFGFLAPRKLVVASNLGWQILTIAHGIFVYAMLFLTTLSIRRRFKIH